MPKYSRRRLVLGDHASARALHGRRACGAVDPGAGEDDRQCTARDGSPPSERSSTSALGRTWWTSSEWSRRIVSCSSTSMCASGGATHTTPGSRGAASTGLLHAQLRRATEDRGEDARRERRQVDDGEHGRVELGRQAAEDDLERTDAAGRADDGDDVYRPRLSRRSHPAPPGGCGSSPPACGRPRRSPRNAGGSWRLPPCRPSRQAAR